MDELCPLCLKMGSNKRIKAVQINLDEAVWMCENEECPWPFGYQAPNFLVRKVGVKWSNEWDIYRKVQKRIGLIPVSRELSLYTPPVTPSSDTASKESARNDYSSERNVSDQISHVGKILACSDDVYAPRSGQYNGDRSNEIGRGTELSDTTVVGDTTDSDVFGRRAPVRQSIFDIDVAIPPSGEASIGKSCNETMETDVPAVSGLLDIRKSAKPTDTVLEPSKGMGNPSRDHVDANKLDIVHSAGQEDEAKKAIPQIRSISLVNIDLQLMDGQRVVKDEPNDFHESIDVGTADIAERMERTDLPKEVIKLDSPEKSEATDLRSDLELTSKEESAIPTMGRTPSSCQRTTTITVDGSLPVILSYDLKDLEGKSDETIPVASVPVRESTGEGPLAQREKVNETVTETSAELPKKRIRPVAKRRGALIGKRYEKFSFGALKKFVPASIDTVDTSSGTLVASNTCQAVKLEETSIKAENSLILDVRIDPSDNPANIDILDVSNQQIGSLNSANADSGNTRMMSDDPIVESLNLSSVLDDILIDGYQNATESLNDDWLESFFT